jgi:hypothetical protein
LAPQCSLMGEGVLADARECAGWERSVVILTLAFEGRGAGI